MQTHRPLIAIVDDDEAVLRALRRLLRACGLPAETFASGRAFLEALPRQVPACVLLDIQMPGLDGWEVQAELATAGWRVPVIFITAHEDAAAQERAVSVVAIVDPFIPTQTVLKGPGGLPILNVSFAGSSPHGMLETHDFVCEDRFNPDRRTEVRIYCKYVVGVKVRTLAMIHLPEEVASRLAEGVSQALAAISAALASSGAGAPAAVWTALVGALVTIGYNTLKNSDGSLDLRVRTAAVYYWFESTGNDIPFYTELVTCTAVLNAL